MSSRGAFFLDFQPFDNAWFRELPFDNAGFQVLRKHSARLRGKTALLLGARGFVGHYLSTLLTSVGVRVVGTTTVPGKVPAPTAGVRHWLSADSTNQDSLKSAFDAARPDMVINLSRHGFPRGDSDFSSMWAANTVGVMNLLNVLSGFPQCTLIQVGSSTEYEPSAGALGAETPIRPVGDFGRTKAAASLLVETWATGHGRPASVVRPFTIYGPGQHSNRFLPVLFRAVEAGKKVSLVGDTRRDYVHAGDVATSILRASLLASEKVPQFAVGTGVSFSPREVVAFVEETVGRKISIARRAKASDPIDVPEWRADSHDLRQRLGWECQVALQDGIEAWWRKIS